MSQVPVFPLLKLPYLCIEAVVLNLCCHDIVIFSFISKRTYRLVKTFKSPVTSMSLYLEEKICLDMEPIAKWKADCRDEELFENIDYYSSLFKCSVDYLKIDGDYLPEDNINFSFNKLKTLIISGKEEISNDKLKYLLENFEVTDSLEINIPVSNTFSCDPKLFKAKVLEVMGPNSAGWITGDFFSQIPLDSIHRLVFERSQITIEDVVAVITKWFCSGEECVLKGLAVVFDDVIEPVDWAGKRFKTMPFDPERRPKAIINTRGNEIDFSNGLDIVRSDGQLATIYVERNHLIFHIWSETERRGLPTIVD
ncbi:unnamed protein product [Caenorhabditis brenneri]